MSEEKAQPPPADARAADVAEANAGLAPKRRVRRETKLKTKSDAVISLLARPRGATLDDMMKATGWQSHSVRGFLAGTLKKKLGRSVTSEATEKGRIYRIAPEAS